MAKKILLTILFIFLFFIIAAVGCFFYYNFCLTPVNSSETNVESLKIQVPSGRTILSVAEELENHGIIRSKYVFYLEARLKNIGMKAGVYALSTDMSVSEMFEMLQTGRQDHLIVSIPEGLTLSKIALILEENDVVDRVSFMDAARNPTLLKEYDIPFNSFEGYVFPDTYYFNPGMSAEAVLRMMVDTFFLRISSIESLQGITSKELFDVVRLASIVEREYRIASEAPLIASVFSNRLRRGIGLYSCATVEYIITEIEGRPHPDVITNKDLKINSPYNTYMWAGLPPGPISNPGMIALKAAAQPPKTSYYFFRLVDPATGEHYFSEGFDEHVDVGRVYTKKAAGS